MAKKKSGNNYQNDDPFSVTDDSSMMVSLGDTDNDMDASESPKSGRGQQGFASMSKEKQREIASKGGKAAHQQGTAHEWNSKEAAEAGRRGGQSRTSSSNTEE